MKQSYKDQYFKFKRFGLFHGFNSFKIGTDAVILGAWCGKNISPKKILDIGTGCGVVALMLAQRFDSALIEGIDVDEACCKLALENFNQSPFEDRMKVSNVDLKTFQPIENYDLIVSNPPFFNQSLLPSNKTNARSKHSITISLHDIFTFVKQNLSEEGHFSIIYPLSQIGMLKAEAEKTGLNLSRTLLIRPNPDAAANRCIIEFTLRKNELVNEEHLIIENAKRHDYHFSYRNLCKDFYLKF